MGSFAEILSKVAGLDGVVFGVALPVNTGLFAFFLVLGPTGRRSFKELFITP